MIDYIIKEENVPTSFVYFRVKDVVNHCDKKKNEIVGRIKVRVGLRFRSVSHSFAFLFGLLIVKE